MMRKMLLILVACCGLSLGGAASAVPITGDPVGNAFGWVPNSTNALNYAKQVPGREGQAVPYVIFLGDAPGEVTLEFNNEASGLAFFEVRLDDIATGLTGHPVVIGDTIHTGGVAVASGTLGLERTFTATSTVDIRLALGGERDWDFDWVRFEVGPVSVPEPATLGLAVAGILGVAVRRRRAAA